jgi:hypothetical protein
VNEPFVLALLTSSAPRAALEAGFEEEGVPLEVETAEGAPEKLARAAAKRAVLGVGLGGDGERLAVALASGPARPYLVAVAEEARAFGHDAARLVARRPLRGAAQAPS